VSGHEGIVGNGTADQLAKTGYQHQFTGPEPACGISIGVAKKAARDWTNRNHKKHWESVTGLKQAKGLILGPSARRTKDLLKFQFFMEPSDYYDAPIYKVLHFIRGVGLIKG
jgi:hypothetical protein